MPHFLYILYSESADRYYIGQTDDMNSRMDYHNSGHSIELIVYLEKPPNEADSVWNLNSGAQLFSSGSIRGEIATPPPFPSDSAKVIFDDSVFIMHYRLAVQPASRSILISDSWSGEEIEEYKYKWEYIFSDADYLEALEIRK